MNDAVFLPGLEKNLGPASMPKPPGLAPPRLKPVNRGQMLWHPIDMERLIEEDHPARAIWALSGQLDLARFYEPIEAVQGVCGRKPWDPRLLISLWVYAYSRGVSSAREVARRCEYEPGFQWLCALEKVNHHTLSDFRVLHQEALQELFAQLLGVLSAEGLISLERVMHDGTKIRADAGRQSFRRQETLQRSLEAARQQVQALWQEEGEDATRQQAARQRSARQRAERVQAALEQLEQIRAAKSGRQEKEKARASTSDPQARVMKQAGGGYAPCYNAQISTEASHKIVVAVEISQQGNDYAELTPAVERIKKNLQAAPKQMVVDGGFTSRENIVQMAAQGIDLIGSLPDAAGQSAAGTARGAYSAEFTPAAFQYDAAENIYRCPAGETLRATRQQKLKGAIQRIYQAPAAACQTCPSKAQCCPRSPKRILARLEEGAQTQAFRQKMQTPLAQQIYGQRAEVAEFPHAWIKEKLGLRRFRARGLTKVRCEALWACLTYNIQQWIRLRWLPRLA